VSAVAAPAAVEQRARALAGGIFTGIGILIEWNCPGSAPRGITISFGDSTPDKELPGALAYAQPFADHILVFGDRVEKSVPMVRARFLAYVIVHEIAHVLQGIRETFRQGDHEGALGSSRSQRDVFDETEIYN